MELQLLLNRLNDNKVSLSSVNGKPVLFPDVIILNEHENDLLDDHLHNSDFQNLVGNYFRNIAINFKNKTAVSYKNQVISYEELEKRSNKAAKSLANSGMRRNDVVAVSLPKSVDLIAIIIGIFKLGYTYLPIDQTLPFARRQYMLSNSNCSCLIVDNAEESLVSAVDEKKINIISKDTLFEDQRLEGYNENCNASPDDIAYLLYTSGSTGTPKGVEISQKAIAEHIHEISKQYGIIPEDRVLQFSNFSFDPSIEQIFVALTNGATLYLADDDLLHSDLIIDYLIKEKITFLNTSPKFAESIFSDLFSDKKISSELSLNTLVIGGEAADRKFCKHWSNSILGRNRNLINAFGPTETTITATLYSIPQNFDADRVPIGKPIKGTKAYIANEFGELLNYGEKGELYLSGTRLAVGYKGLTEETNSKFVHPEFTGGERCYKTGDLVSWAIDGNLIFHGRIDKQVKIRGYRIEPQEVESILNRCNSIEQSRVIPHQISTGTQLVAFLKSNQIIETESVKEEIKKQLPDYMIPSHFIVLQDFPLNFNGKIDDKALLLHLAANESVGYQVPVSTVEKILIQIWEEVLNTPKIGIKDNFFSLGGHSIAAIRIISKIRSKLKKDVKLSVFYQYPTIESLSGVLTNIKDSDSLISKGNYDGLLNVSPAQKGLWLQLQFGYLKAYHITGFYQLNRKVDIDTLQTAINYLVDQHEIFRTTFVEKWGHPYRVIHESLDIELKTHNQPINDQLTNEFTDERFDFTNGPLIRFSLFDASSESQTLGIVVSHLISDGWSMSIMLNELVENYEALHQKQKLTIDNERLQYSDYVAWQARYRSILDSSLDYWKKNLEGFQFLNLPTDYSAEKQNSEKGNFHQLELGSELSAAVIDFARVHRITTFNTCFTAIYVLLSKFCNQQDICIGLPLADRDHEQLEKLIGFMVNSVVIRINPDDSITFNDLAILVHNQILEAGNHQNVTFDQLVNHLKPERSGIKNPFFNVQVNYVPLAKKVIAGEEISLSRIPFHDNTSKFDLTFDFEEHDSGDIAIGIEYRTALFTKNTVETLLNSLRSVLKYAMVYQGAQVKLISLLDEQTNPDGKGKYLQPRQIPKLCLNELVERHFEISADKVALAHGSKSITYQELALKVDCLTAILKKEGVNVGDVVTIMMDRSIEMVIAFLSVMKMGAAYLPVSKDLPVDRISYMVSNSHSLHLISTRRESSEIRHILKEGEIDTINKVFIDADDLTKVEYLPLFLPETDQQNTAYIIYTSGSTGRPKGVMISHEAIVNHMHWMESAFDWRSDDVFIQKTAVTFDASVWEFFLPLMMGNQLVLSANSDHTDPELLVSEILQNNVTVLQGTPTLLEYLNKQGAFEKCGSLRWLFSGGEALKVSTASAIKKHLNGRLINLYGPTECAIDATYYEYKENLSCEIVPIGKAIYNMVPMILDTNGELLPDGFIGELCFAGYGVAKGYINQEELTEKSFLSDKTVFVNRYYKTGDLARKDHDGNIHYMGRKDQQLKIRGVRIEAGEIEGTLESFDGVIQVGVILSDNKLIAYFESTKEVNVTELKKHASVRLPAYIIPAHFVQLDELPKTQSGKLDRRKLQMLGVPKITKEVIKPENDTECKLLDIWKEVFDQLEISVLDNFFEIGGHSLIGMQIILKVKNEMKYNISLKDLFEKADIRSLSELLLSEGANLAAEQEEDIISNYGEESQELIL